MQGPLAVWSSAVFSSTGDTSFKAYFNTQARGPDQSEALVEEGLRRFGLQRAWQRLRATALRRGSSLDELKYFALDLSSGPEARIKIYVRHHEAALNDLELAASAAAGYHPGEALEFAHAMRGNAERLHARAGFTCHSFTSQDDDCPTATTVYVPVCAYARDDAAVTRRIHDYLVAQALDPAAYDAIMGGFANRALDAGVGMQSWAAFRRHGAQSRLTVYLATEANRVHAPGSIPAPTPDRSRFLAGAARRAGPAAPSRIDLAGEGSPRCGL
jgi:DMATS type aromatic prenyltransferase